MKHRGHGTFSGNISAKKATFSDVAAGVTPVLPNHLATKDYVDNQAGGGPPSPGFYGVIFKQSNGANGYRNDTLIFNSESFYLTGTSINKPMVNWRGGVTSHAALTGLAADDHAQYLLGTGTRAATGNFNFQKDVNVQKDLEVSGSFYLRNRLEVGSNAVMHGPVSVGNPGAEEASIVVGGVTYDAILKTNEIGGTRAGALILHRHSTTIEPAMTFAASNSETADHTLMVNNQLTGRISFTGHSGGAQGYIRNAEIQAIVDGTPTSTSMPGRLTTLVTPVGSTTPETAMTIFSTKNVTFIGDVGVGAATQPAVKLGAYSQTGGFLKPRMPKANWSAISSPPAGLEVYDSDFYIPIFRGRDTWQPITNGFSWVDMQDDFIGALLTTGNIGALGWAFAGTAPTVIAGVADHPGILSQSCNNSFSTITCDQTLTGGINEAIHSSNFSYMCFILRTDSSTIANTELVCGLAAGNVLLSISAATVGVFFKYDSAVDAFFRTFVNNVGSTSTTTNVTAVANTWYRFEVSYDGTTIRFYVNGNQVASSVNTNFPNEALKWFVQIRSTTAAARTYQIDYSRMVASVNR